MAHIRQSRPDSGRGFQVKGRLRCQFVPFSLGSEREREREGGREGERERERERKRERERLTVTAKAAMMQNFWFVCPVYVFRLVCRV